MNLPQLALDYLFDQLTTELPDRVDIPPALHFGWREAPKQINQGNGGANRVILMPGDPTGKVGDLAGGKLPGRNPTPIATMYELGTLYCWAYDASAPTDAKLQWRAARRLHDAVVAVCIRAFLARWKRVSATWIRSELERPFGAEIQMVFAVEAYVPDLLIPKAAPGTVTNINLNGIDC